MDQGGEERERDRERGKERDREREREGERDREGEGERGLRGFRLLLQEGDGVRDYTGSML